MTAVSGARPRVGRRCGPVLVVGLLLLAACGADPIDAAAPASGGPVPGGPVVTEATETDDGPGPITIEPAGRGVTIAADRTSGVPVALDAIPVRSARFDDTELPVVPVSLRIDGLDVDAPIMAAGVEPNGEMELPGAIEAAWYRHGPTPGADQGSSVIAAHVDWDGRPGPFFGLRDLPTGSIVVVGLSDGTEARYRTVDTAQYEKADLPIDELFRRDGGHALALITCGGSYDSAERSYSDNVVTIALPL